MDFQGIQAFSSADPAAMEAAAAGVAAAGIVAVLILVIALLIIPIVMGIMCRRLARHKGYTGYFWTGFFFGVLGLIYVVGLPDLHARKDMRAVMKRLVSVSDRVDALENSQFTKRY